jgi:hypothetical protein
MPESGGLINLNLGELAKPATVLVERISDAVGGIAKPWQIKRVARAEADAELIHAEARIQISELERRALNRMVREESQRQENIENITAKALYKLLPDARPEQVERDWITHLFDRARLISDSEMQSLWAGILAGEANRPGSFSKKTIELMASLDKSDAQLFAKLCSFCWDIEGLTPLILDNREIYGSHGIQFDSLRHLDTIGLIDSPGFGYERGDLPSPCTTHYFGTPIVIEVKTSSIELGSALFTRAGEELARICQAERSECFFEFILQRWINLGLCPSMPVRTSSDADDKNAD